MPAKKPAKRVAKKPVSNVSRKTVQSKLSKKTRPKVAHKTIKKTARLKSKQGKRVKALEHVQVHYNRARNFLDIKVPRTSIRLGAILLSLTIIVVIISWPQSPHSLELIQTESCDLGQIPEESLALYHRFGIQNTTTFYDFNNTFANLKEDIPGLTVYYGPGFGQNNPKNGVGVHFSPTSAAGFILIWDKPFFATFEETEESLLATRGDFYSKLTTIWIFNGQNDRVCEVKL